MTSDWRAALYDRYVTTFKGTPELATEPSAVWWDHKYLPLLHDLDRAAPILEIGCGSGGLLAYLGQRGFSHAVGVDISAEQVSLATRRGASAECADILDYLHGQRGAFEVIFAVDVFEHFSRDELVILAPRVFEALRPGGRLIVQTANGAGLFPRQVIYGDLTHLTIFTPESLVQLLRRFGFQNLRFYETGPIPIRLRGKLDVALWSATKAIANFVRQVETGKRQPVWTENFICAAFKPG